MKIGILTGGGDCPGLNAAIRAIVKYGVKRYGDEFLGILYGWRGLLKKEVVPLTAQDASGILVRGGTILYSSRTNPLKEQDGLLAVQNNFNELELDALIVIGGEDTLTVAYAGFTKTGLQVVGVPKTIDNDVYGTDTTIGFTTAYRVITEAVDRIHSTAESHNMIHIIETMGRKAGWIALRAGIAGGADIILIPEFPLSIDEICDLIERRKQAGKNFSIIVVAEGYPLGEKSLVTRGSGKDEFGHEQLGGVGEQLASILRKRTGFDARVTNPGYMQRGGTPEPYDRWIATRMGIKAVDLVHNRQFGRMVAVVRNEIVDVELREAESKNRLVPQELFEELRWLFG